MHPAGKPPFDMVGRDKDGRAVVLVVKLVVELLVFELFPWQLFTERQKRWLQDFASNGAVASVCVYEGRHERMTAFFLQSTSFDNVTTFELPRVVLTKQGIGYRGWNDK